MAANMSIWIVAFEIGGPHAKRVSSSVPPHRILWRMWLGIDNHHSDMVTGSVLLDLGRLRALGGSMAVAGLGVSSMESTIRA